MTILKDMNEFRSSIDVALLDDITAEYRCRCFHWRRANCHFSCCKSKNVSDALSNQDPFSKAFVMARGIIGDRQGERVCHITSSTNNILV